jgi:hypothetical protein
MLSSEIEMRDGNTSAKFMNSPTENRFLLFKIQPK